ncbi:three-Cys-motif partner protein TcmP [Azospirillum argentinense]
MVGKAYQWAEGAILEEHSKRKHKILREYFSDYLSVRCGHRRRNRFRLAIMDGFAGGGRYRCGSPGSPLIFLQELQCAVQRINIKRAIEGSAPLSIECLLILNDADRNAVEALRENIAPIHQEIHEGDQKLSVHIEYSCEKFEHAYLSSKQKLQNYRNVIFNLDQCGDMHIKIDTIHDIMSLWAKAEIFYTFMISSLVAFLQKREPDKLLKRLSYLGIERPILQELDNIYSRKEWLGAAERMVFDTLQNCSSFVSPFSINNPGGWQYWFMHFSNSYRARQVYNNILHKNSSFQAHFGRSGIDMLVYDQIHEMGQLYLFDSDGRKVAREQLFNDTPRFVSDFGESISVREFFQKIYNTTPAHQDDINAALIDNPDLEIKTPTGGTRRKDININDIIMRKPQRSFYAFLGSKTKEKN